MKKGPLNRRVAFYRETLLPDGYGDPRPTFVRITGAWASVRPAPGTERLATGEAAANAPTVIRVRWNPVLSDLNPKDQVEYPEGSGKMLDIKSVVEVGRREGLEVAAVGRADQ